MLGTAQPTTRQEKKKLFNLDSSSSAMTTSPPPSIPVPGNCFQIHQVASYLSVLQLHCQDQLVAVVGQRLAVVSLGEECRAQIPVGTAFPCLVTWKEKKKQREKVGNEKAIMAICSSVYLPLLNSDVMNHILASVPLKGKVSVRGSPQ